MNTAHAYYVYKTRTGSMEVSEVVQNYVQEVNIGAFGGIGESQNYTTSKIYNIFNTK